MTGLKKRCENCNRLFGRRKLKSGFTETPGVFAKKRYCSRLCGCIAVQAKKKMAIDEARR